MFWIQMVPDYQLQNITLSNIWMLPFLQACLLYLQSSLSLIVQLNFPTATRIQGACLPGRTCQVSVHLWSPGDLTSLRYMKCLILIVHQKVQDNYINANTNTRTNIINSRTTTPQTTLASKNRGMATAPRANILSICLTVGCKRWHIYVKVRRDRYFDQ